MAFANWRVRGREQVSLKKYFYVFRPVVFNEHERVVALLRETVSTYEASFERP